jgi:hypothetical protein
MINKEISTAVNIKCKINKKKVIISLKAIFQFLKKYKNSNRIVDDDIVIYSGVIDSNEIIFEVIINKVPLKNKLYCCDKVFKTHIFDEIYEKIKNNNLYLVLYLDGDSVTFYNKFLSTFTKIKNLTFERQKKQKKGGSSAPRIERIREQKITCFINKTIYEFNNIIHNSGNKYKAILICGNGSIIEGVKEKIKSIIPFYFIQLISKHDLLIECNQIINSINQDDDVHKIHEFQDILTLNSDQLVFGYNDILKHIYEIEEIIISASHPNLDILKEFNEKLYIVKNDTTDFLNNFEGIIAKKYY